MSKDLNELKKAATRKSGGGELRRRAEANVLWWPQAVCLRRRVRLAEWGSEAEWWRWWGADHQQPQNWRGSH